MPRLSITGLPADPTACSSAKFCMLRVPTWSMSAHSATSVDVGRVDHLGDDRQAGLGAHVGEDLAGRACPAPGRRTARCAA